MVETFRIANYIVVFAVEGFPLSEVSLYTYSEISYTVNFILEVPWNLSIQITITVKQVWLHKQNFFRNFILQPYQYCNDYMHSYRSMHLMMCSTLVFSIWTMDLPMPTWKTERMMVNYFHFQVSPFWFWALYIAQRQQQLQDIVLPTPPRQT